MVKSERTVACGSFQLAIELTLRKRLIVEDGNIKKIKNGFNKPTNTYSAVLFSYIVLLNMFVTITASHPTDTAIVTYLALICLAQCLALQALYKRHVYGLGLDKACLLIDFDS